MRPIVSAARVKSGGFGQSRKPLLHTTIQKMGSFGNRVSLRKTGLFSGRKKAEGLLMKVLAVVIFEADLCSIIG